MPHTTIVCLCACLYVYPCIYTYIYECVSCLYVCTWLAKISFVYKSITFDCFTSDIMNILLGSRGISVHGRICVCVCVYVIAIFRIILLFSNINFPLGYIEPARL